MLTQTDGIKNDDTTTTTDSPIGWGPANFQSGIAFIKYFTISPTMNGYKMLPFLKYGHFSIYKAVILQRGNPKTKTQILQSSQWDIPCFRESDRAVREQKKDMIYFLSTSSVEQSKLFYKPDAKNMYYTHVYIFIFLYIYIHIHKMVQFDSHVTKKKIADRLSIKNKLKWSHMWQTRTTVGLICGVASTG